MQTLLEELSVILTEMEDKGMIPKHIRKLSSGARKLGSIARAAKNADPVEHFKARHDAAQGHKVAHSAVMQHLRKETTTPRQYKVLSKLADYHSKLGGTHEAASHAVIKQHAQQGSYADQAKFLTHVANHIGHDRPTTEVPEHERPKSGLTQAHAKDIENRSYKKGAEERRSADAKHREDNDPEFKSKVDTEVAKKNAEREAAHKASVAAAAEREAIAKGDKKAPTDDGAGKESSTITVADEKPPVGEHERKGRDTLVNKALEKPVGPPTKAMTAKEREDMIKAAMEAKKKAGNK